MKSSCSARSLAKVGRGTHQKSIVGRNEKDITREWRNRAKTCTPLLFGDRTAAVSRDHAGEQEIGDALIGVNLVLDASEAMLLRWYVDRFLTLRSTAFSDPKSYFHRYSKLSDDEAVATATSIWTRINLINLHENVLPTRQRADLILRKGASHYIEEVALRKL